MVFLDSTRLLDDTFVAACDILLEKALPFPVRESILVQLFQLNPKVCDQLGIALDGDPFIALTHELVNKLILQRGFALVLGTPLTGRLVLDNDRRFRGRRDDVVGAHEIFSFSTLLRRSVSFTPL